MDNEKFAEELYEAHKLLWMLQHGHTLTEVVQLSSDALIDAIHENPDEQLDCIEFSWEETGFRGEIWPSFEEFMDNEFKDAVYINNLISQMPEERQVELAHFHTAEMLKIWKEEEMVKNTVTYYGVTEYSNGAEHRWIFDEDTLSKAMYNGGPVPDEDDKDIGFPIAGSNNSYTWIKKLSTEESIKNYLTMLGAGPDFEDPMLIDIGEYYLSVDNDHGSCTDKFVKKFNLDYSTLNQKDDLYHHKANAEKMLTALKELGYKDFDFEDPFYGDNSDMTYDELCGLYKAQIIDKLGLDPDKLQSVSVNSDFNEDEKFLSVIVSFSTEEGDNKFICVDKQSSSTEFGLRLFGNTPRLINAESCTYDAEHLEQWTYKNENIWEYESLPRRKILEISQKDKLKPGEITTAILYYEHFNYGLFDSPADGHYSVPMVKQMIEDGFSKDRIAIIGKYYNAKEILKNPEVENFYKKTRDRLTKAGAVVKNNKGH